MFCIAYKSKYDHLIELWRILVSNKTICQSAFLLIQMDSCYLEWEEIMEILSLEIETRVSNLCHTKPAGKLTEPLCVRNILVNVRITDETLGNYGLRQYFTARLRRFAIVCT